MGRFQPSLLARDPAERARFLLALRATGTIRGAAEATGAAVATVNRLRKRDHDFAAARATVMGDPRTYTLEAAFLARLTDGVERKRIYADGRVETWRDYNDALAFAVLQRLWPDRWSEGAGAAALSADRERLWGQVAGAAFLTDDEKRHLLGLDGLGGTP